MKYLLPALLILSSCAEERPVKDVRRGLAARYCACQESYVGVIDHARSGMQIHCTDKKSRKYFADGEDYECPGRMVL